MPDNIQVDGVKKFSEEEIKQSRKIVLETIGEKEAEEKKKEEEKSGFFSKKVDGILSSTFLVNAKKNQNKEKEEEEADNTKLKINAEQKKTWQEEINKVLPVTADIKVQTALEKVPEKKVPLPKVVKKEESEKKPFKLHETIKKIKPKHPDRRKEQKAKKNEKKTVKRQTVIDRKIKSWNEKIDHLLATPIFAGDWDWEMFRRNLEHRLNVGIRRALKYLFLFFCFSLLLYLLLILGINKSDSDNKLLRKIGEFLPIPAIITRDGIVEYYQFKDFATSNNLSNEQAIAEYIYQSIINNLINKYKISRNNYDELLKKVVYDDEINKASLDRIRKIKEFINKGEDFIAIANKYGDEVTKIKLTKQSDKFIFNDQIIYKESGEVSEIINSLDGFYIYKVMDKNNESLELVYVYIKAKTLNDYLPEAISNYKYFSLIKIE